jgi:hypothetical protein
MDLESDFTCPNCKRQFKIKVKEMVPGRSKSCPFCRTRLSFTGADGRKAQRAMDELQKTIKKLSR